MRKGYRGMGLCLALGLAGCQQTAPKTVTTTLPAHPRTVAAQKPIPVPVKPWMWMTGARSKSQPSANGIAGTEGVASPDNTPPSVNSAASWRGLHGGLYLLGGAGRYDMPRDGLWKYTPATGLWMRVKGGGIPSPRYAAAAWTGPHGGVWIFGGVGVNFKHANQSPPTLDSLWRYTPKTNWVRIGGPHVNDAQDAVMAHSVRGTQGVASPKNWPAPRHDAAAWTGQHGDFWLFGGQGNGHIRHGLWKYSPATRRWTWMGGPIHKFGDDAGGAKPAVYGIRGVPAPGNWPGRRTDAVTWVGPHGSLWLFGGSDDSVARNDLWKYTPGTGLWTWMGGSYHHSRLSVRGTLGVPAPTNWPGARYGAVGWTGPQGNFWLFGGVRPDNSVNGPTFVNYHGVWKYTVATGLWTWMGSGHRTGHEKTGFIGPRGVPTNEGPSEAYASAWTGLHGHFWLFGGIGNLNDLWRYTP